MPLRYLLNPCDIDRHRHLTALGDGIASLWHLFTRGTECPCCLGTRLILLTLAAVGLGAAVGYLGA